MSGTASANVFSSDPGKKFDVVFSIDMKQLLASLGAKPEQIAKIMAQAEINRKKPIALTSTSMFGLAGMAGLDSAMAGALAGGMSGGMPGGMAGAQGGGGMQMQGMAGGQGGGGQRGPGGMMVAPI